MDEPNRPDSPDAPNQPTPNWPPPTPNWPPPTPNWPPPTPNWPPPPPPNWRRLQKIARILLAAGEYAEAEAILRAALTAASSRLPQHSAELGTIWLDLAECLSALGDPTGSEAADAQARSILLHYLTSGTVRLATPTTNKPTPD